MERRHAQRDEATGHIYYFNEQTGESQWEPPPSAYAQQLHDGQHLYDGQQQLYDGPAYYDDRHGGPQAYVAQQVLWVVAPLEGVLVASW